MSTFRNDLFAGVSGLTSNVYLVADAADLTLQANATSSTGVTVQGSNVRGFDGFDEADWSTLTTISGITQAEMLYVQPGFRWLRVVRESATSLPSATLVGRNVVWGHG